jgi:hypothetical protein
VSVWVVSVIFLVVSTLILAAVSIGAASVLFFSSVEEGLVQLQKLMMDMAISPANNFERRLILIGVAMLYIFMEDRLNTGFF